MKKDKKVLKVFSILYIIFGIGDICMTIACLCSLFGVISPEELAALDKATLNGSMVLYTIKTALFAFIELYFGIMGLKFLKEKYDGAELLKCANLFFGAEVICCAVAVLGVVLRNDDWTVLVSTVANLIVLVIYVHYLKKVQTK